MKSYRVSNVLKIVVILTSVLSTSLYAQEITLEVPFSHEAGFYQNPLYLTLGQASEQYQIIYTIDGSVPHFESLNGRSYHIKNSYAEFPGSTGGALITREVRSLNYSGVIEINNRSPEENVVSSISTTFHLQPHYFPDSPVMKATIVRARYFDPKTIQMGPVTTRTYFISDGQFDGIKLPIVSISANNYDLFDYETGIYVAGKLMDESIAQNPTVPAGVDFDANYHQRGDEWERIANFEYFPSTNDSQTLNQQIGIRIHGGYSRIYPNKSLRLYARSEYGNSNFEYKLFKSRSDTKFKRLILRNSGNDYEFTMFRDAFIHELVRDLNFETMAVTSVILFINGEYWGIHHLRERQDDRYLERLFGIDRSKLDYLTNNMEVEEGSAEHYELMLDFIRNNSLESDSNFQIVETMMDIDNYIDYLATQTFIGNTDWPSNNIEYWRIQTEFEPDASVGHDGRWRWLFKDSDFGFGLFRTLPSVNSFTYLLQPLVAGETNPLWSTELFRELNKNESFKKRFYTRYLDLLNTTFKKENVWNIADSMRTVVEPHIRDHISRWKKPSSYESWVSEVEYMLNEYIASRSDYTMIYLRSRYRLGGIAHITLNLPDPSEGSIRLNTIDFDGKTGQWQGVYTKNGTITLEALPKQGFEFSHWVENSDAESLVEILPEHGQSYTAVFVPSTGTEEIESLPKEVVLLQNYPNPFNPKTFIRFALPEAQQITIQVYDINGRIVSEVLDNATYTAGHHQVSYDGSKLTTGVYMYTLSSSTGITQTRKLLLIK